MSKLRTVWSLVLLGACVGLAYKGFENTRIPHPVDAHAEAVACEEMQACAGPTANWVALDASPFARIYTLDVGSGRVTIECRWAAVMFGEVTCRGEREPLLEPVDDKPVQRPHELERGMKK